ncbi:molybdopterin molybdotransferase MoeA [Thalassovita mediterranea]|jgi:molybdopterin molybdotransferase|uniref:Molybdopterin molybdenumtransferase n=1 Tax=Thalassovita mediterranea TaxID=340021 RepID=A0A0P1GMG8_9RHOB|nr:gephyrin-like molybdotransferase Glp [Thalassovita mediterranea]CUH83441.1 Molybdopterin molybdenumtransferase [Thalassovita mediterranea]SIS34901.1 molybdopterin molybdotransferase [Thalassovita mediterranea]
MIPVADALAHLFALTPRLGSETVPLVQAAGRVLAEEVSAKRTQPPFAASAMDGYAVHRDAVAIGAQFIVVGEAAAGQRFDGTVGEGDAIRIFTGAPLPDGDFFVVIQEDVDRNADTITIARAPGSNDNIRPAGGDFTEGTVLSAPRILSPADIALLAAMNIAEVPVAKRPDVALISTGNELVMPGETPGPDQIIASNTFGLKAMLDQHGAHCRILPIARDDVDSLKTAFDLAKGADLVITIGGASVGDHDLVAPVLADLGTQRSFYKVAMRPGKPLMAGQMPPEHGGAMMIGLPGNPVSAMVCGAIFLLPVVRAMQGLPTQAQPRKIATLTADLRSNGPREHYMRALVTDGKITVFDRQDSSLLSVLAAANALVVCPPNSDAKPAGSTVEYIEF